MKHIAFFIAFSLFAVFSQAQANRFLEHLKHPRFSASSVPTNFAKVDADVIYELDSMVYNALPFDSTESSVKGLFNFETNVEGDVGMIEQKVIYEDTVNYHSRKLFFYDTYNRLDYCLFFTKSDTNENLKLYKKVSYKYDSTNYRTMESYFIYENGDFILDDKYVYSKNTIGIDSIKQRIVDTTEYNASYYTYFLYDEKMRLTHEIDSSFYLNFVSVNKVLNIFDDEDLTKTELYYSSEDDTLSEDLFITYFNESGAEIANEYWYWNDDSSAYFLSSQFDWKLRQLPSNEKCAYKSFLTDDEFIPIKTSPQYKLDSLYYTEFDNQYVEGYFVYKTINTNIQETNKAKQQLTLFPNPTSEQLTIKTGVVEPLVAQVFDNTGKLIDVFSVSQIKTYNVSHLPTGSYQLRLINKGNMHCVETFIVK